MEGAGEGGDHRGAALGDDDAGVGVDEADPHEDLVVARQPGGPDPALEQAAQSKDEVVRTAARQALGKDGGAYARQPGRRLLISGLKLPTRCEMFRNGQKHMDLVTVEVEFFNAFADNVFARPDQAN